MGLRVPWLFLTVFVIATAGLVYELLAGAISTTVLGNSLRQYSLTIGVYLFAMGVGAYGSKFLERRLAERFVDLEFATALLGGTQGLLLYMAYGRAEAFSFYLYGTLFLVGMLVGIEVPLLMRILREELDFKDLVAKVLTFDYLGSLVGSLIFSVVLVEYLMVPLERIGLMFGMLNCAVGLLSTWLLTSRIHPRRLRALRIKGVLVAAALIASFVLSPNLRTIGEQGLYGQRIVHGVQSAYQRLVLTSDGRHLQMFLDGNLQWSSIDEYRYHEGLVHPALALAPRKSRVLILGGGDGLAARELLRYQEVSEVVLVDLDPAVTAIASTHNAIRKLNHNSLADSRVRILHDDALVYLDKYQGPPFDVVIADFPDPNNFSLGKLYTRHFYKLVQKAMGNDSALVVQSTSPLFARKSFWCIEHSMRAAGLFTAPYHVTVPSFGEWGYVLAMGRTFVPPTKLHLPHHRYINDNILKGLFAFSSDMSPVETEVNRLHKQVLVQYYASEWSKVF